MHSQVRDWLHPVCKEARRNLQMLEFDLPSSITGKPVHLQGEATQFLGFCSNRPNFTCQWKILMNHPSPKAYLEKTNTELFTRTDVVMMQASGIITDHWQHSKWKEHRLGQEPRVQRWPRSRAEGVEFPSEENHRRQRDWEVQELGRNSTMFHALMCFPFLACKLIWNNVDLYSLLRLLPQHTDWVAGSERSLCSCGSEERRWLELWELSGPPLSARKAHVLFAQWL